MDEDKELIIQYLAGDKRALERLIMRYQRQVYGFIYRMLNDMDDAKDVTQEVFVRMFNGLQSFRMEASFKTWLYQIATNTSLNSLKKTQREKVRLDELVEDDHKPGISTEVMEKEQREYLRASLDELPERQKLALILRLYNGFSYAETAAAMGCSEGAVKAHYHNAVSRLREILKEKGHEFRP
jgi:RNA polymerase sigma-70 factor (ECF subfamily)